MNSFQAKLLEYRELAPEVRHFVLEAPTVDKLVYTPGQFVAMYETLKGRKVTRAYSVASPPDGNRFELCLNRVQNGAFTPYLFELEPGDTINVKGPLGYFVARHPISDSVFVATGTGIAPMRSMLKQMLEDGDEHQFTLIFGVRHEYGIFYREEFEEMAAKHPNFRFWPTLSRPEPSWKGRSGHVQAHLAEAVGDRRDIDTYICGLKEMVYDVRASLTGMGFDRKRVIFEKYD